MLADEPLWRHFLIEQGVKSTERNDVIRQALEYKKSMTQAIQTGDEKTVMALAQEASQWQSRIIEWYTSQEYQQANKRLQNILQVNKQLQVICQTIKSDYEEVSKRLSELQNMNEKKLNENITIFEKLDIINKLLDLATQASQAETQENIATFDDRNEENFQILFRLYRRYHALPEQNKKKDNDGLLKYFSNLLGQDPLTESINPKLEKAFTDLTICILLRGGCEKHKLPKNSLAYLDRGQYKPHQHTAAVEINLQAIQNDDIVRITSYLDKESQHALGTSSKFFHRSVSRHHLSRYHQVHDAPFSKIEPYDDKKFFTLCEQYTRRHQNALYNSRYLEYWILNYACNHLMHPKYNLKYEDLSKDYTTVHVNNHIVMTFDFAHMSDKNASRLIEQISQKYQAMGIQVQAYTHRTIESIRGEPKGVALSFPNSFNFFSKLLIPHIAPFADDMHPASPEEIKQAKNYQHFFQLCENCLGLQQGELSDQYNGSGLEGLLIKYAHQLNPKIAVIKDNDINASTTLINNGKTISMRYQFSEACTLDAKELFNQVAQAYQGMNLKMHIRQSKTYQIFEIQFSKEAFFSKVFNPLLIHYCWQEHQARPLQEEDHKEKVSKSNLSDVSQILSL